jgi:hypothetical protein
MGLHFNLPCQEWPSAPPDQASVNCHAGFLPPGPLTRQTSPLGGGPGGPAITKSTAVAFPGAV